MSSTITAEDYAATLLKPYLDKMERPPLNEIADESALTVREVEAIRDRLLAGRRPQPDYRAPGRVATPAASAPAPTPEPWRAAVDHPNARIRRAGAKAVAAVAAVEALLADDAGKAKLRQREAKLLAELTKVRAELRGDAPATERIPCPDCGDLVHPHRIKQHANRSSKHR